MSTNTAEAYGFKSITEDTLLTPDPVCEAFVTLDVSGQLSAIRGTDWLHRIQRPTLGQHVPIEVRRLYEVARGTAAYGYYFYPIFTVAAEQLTRVGEAAIYIRSTPLISNGDRLSFAERITLLRREKIIDRATCERWHWLRELRNLSSHPIDQTIIAPGDFLALLNNLSVYINTLFAETEATAQ